MDAENYDGESSNNSMSSSRCDSSAPNNSSNNNLLFLEKGAAEEKDHTDRKINRKLIQPKKSEATYWDIYDDLPANANDRKLWFLNEYKSLLSEINGQNCLIKEFKKTLMKEIKTKRNKKLVSQLKSLLRTESEKNDGLISKALRIQRKYPDHKWDPIPYSASTILSKILSEDSKSDNKGNSSTYSNVDSSNRMSNISTKNSNNNSNNNNNNGQKNTSLSSLTRLNFELTDCLGISDKSSDTNESSGQATFNDRRLSHQKIQEKLDKFQFISNEMKTISNYSQKNENERKPSDDQNDHGNRSTNCLDCMGNSNASSCTTKFSNETYKSNTSNAKPAGVQLSSKRSKNPSLLPVAKPKNKQNNSNVDGQGDNSSHNNNNNNNRSTECDGNFDIDDDDEDDDDDDDDDVGMEEKYTELLLLLRKKESELQKILDVMHHRFSNINDKTSNINRIKVSSNVTNQKRSTSNNNTYHNNNNNSNSNNNNNNTSNCRNSNHSSTNSHSNNLDKIKNSDIISHLTDRVSVLKSEQTEFRQLIKRHQELLDKYQKKYMRAQNRIVGQKRALETIEKNNRSIENDIKVVITKLKDNYENKLRDFSKYPRLLKLEKNKVETLTKQKIEIEERFSTIAKEYRALKEKLTDKCKKPYIEKAQEKFKSLQRELKVFKNFNISLKEERDRLKEEIKRCHEEFENYRTQTNKLLFKSKDRAEIQRRSFQKKINELESELLQNRASTTCFIKERDKIIAEMFIQLATLNDNLEVSKKYIDSLRKHVNNLSSSEMTIEK